MRAWVPRLEASGLPAYMGGLGPRNGALAALASSLKSGEETVWGNVSVGTRQDYRTIGLQSAYVSLKKTATGLHSQTSVPSKRSVDFGQLAPPAVRWPTPSILGARFHNLPQPSTTFHNLPTTFPQLPTTLHAWSPGRLRRGRNLAGDDGQD